MLPSITENPLGAFYAMILTVSASVGPSKIVLVKLSHHGSTESMVVDMLM
jgi:hypothetical protein